MELPELKETGGVTIGDKYRPAMAITEQADADEYFKRLVAYNMRCRPGRTQTEVEYMERENLGYFAGYYDEGTRERVERLFRCCHPIFGSIAANGPPSAEEALEAGKAMAAAPPPSDP